MAHMIPESAPRFLHTTIGRFKGLESDLVILCDIDPSDPRCNRNALYVAASRARHALYVMARGDWMGESELGPWSRAA